MLSHGLAHMWKYLEGGGAFRKWSLVGGKYIIEESALEGPLSIPLCFPAALS